jgi:RNA polymerase sigma-70 factor (sigma-E family)
MTDNLRQLPDKRIQEVARLLEESSLGTAGARQLRDRALTRTRCRAYFAANADEKWWLANQYDTQALRLKAQDLASSGADEISDLLTQLVNQQATTPRFSSGRGSSQAKDGHRPEREDLADWRSFRDFYQREIGPFIRIVSERTGLPGATAGKLTRKAMTRAFDDWEHIGTLSDPGEWVIGYALQLHRKLELSDEDGSWAPSENIPASESPSWLAPESPTQRADVRVTGALAVAGAAATGTLRTDAPAAATACHHAEWQAAHAEEEWDADHMVTTLYTEQYRSLVRLALLLVHDVQTAEEVVQDAFIALHTGCRRMPNTEKALAYLRQAVVNRSRSVLRHRSVIDKVVPKPAPDEPSAEDGAMALLERTAVIAALRELPDRQREAIVLRYYADLSEAQIAAAMGISRGAVKSHTARGMAALHTVLEREAL